MAKQYVTTDVGVGKVVGVRNNMLLIRVRLADGNVVRVSRYSYEVTPSVPTEPSKEQVILGALLVWLVCVVILLGVWTFVSWGAAL